MNIKALKNEVQIFKESDLMIKDKLVEVVVVKFLKKKWMAEQLLIKELILRTSLKLLLKC